MGYQTISTRTSAHCVKTDKSPSEAPSSVGRSLPPKKGSSHNSKQRTLACKAVSGKVPGGRKMVRTAAKAFSKPTRLGAGMFKTRGKSPKVYLDSAGVDKSGVPKVPPHEGGWIPRGELPKPRIFKANPKAPESQRFKGYRVIELFSGTAHWSRAMARAGIEAWAFDINDFEGNDVTSPDVREHLKMLIADTKTLMVLCGTPCPLWSLGRRGGGHGPPALRDSE